jgi:D-alanine-D-alanine ligase
MTIGLTYDLRDAYLALGYSDDETAELDKLETIEGIEHALIELGHRTIRIGNIFELQQQLIKGNRWDLVFNICEGMHGIGREAQVPALLDAYKIPYTFSDPLVLSLTLHKGLTKQILRDSGIDTADFAVLGKIEEIHKIILPYPLFVKPIAEGSGKGIDKNSLVNNKDELMMVCTRLLNQYKQDVLIETYLDGREFTVGITGTADEAVCVGVMEVQIKTRTDENYYSRFIKENYENRVKYTLAEKEIEDACAKAGLATWRAIGCRDAGRVDIRYGLDGKPYVIEVNPLAGLNHIHSDLPLLMYQKGYQFIDLIAMIIESASKRIMP